jgi:two-component system phosphate regulon response regulator OmpR
MNKNYKILVVDDDPRLRYLIENLLRDRGFLVDGVADGKQLFDKIKYSHYDLIILDWILPGEDGLTICKRLNSEDNSPLVIMLTAKDSKSDCLSSFGSGADDYITKPFDPDELVARIIALLRRRLYQNPSLPDKNSLLFNFGPYSLDIAQRCLFKGSDKINLRPTEFSILRVLAQNAGTAVSREQLSFLIKGQDLHPDDRSIDIQICRIRRLLQESRSSPIYLQTIRNVGYILVQ